MKKLFFLFIIQQLSFSIFAQSGTMLPDVFIVPNTATEGACTTTDKGKIYYNTVTNTMMVCNGTSWVPASSQWIDGNNGTISYLEGFVGINTTTPEYRLDVNGNARVNSDLIVTGKIGIGTTSPQYALEIADGDISTYSTVDNKYWNFDYSDVNNSFSIKEDGVSRMVFANGGNVGIGSVSPTAKFSVDGSGSFDGNLTVNSGKGIVRSADATQLKCHVSQANLGTTFTVGANACATRTVSITSAGFTFSPTAQVGNLVSGTGDFGKLVINVQSANTTQVVVRFCNTTASSITLSNMIFNLLCIGK